MKKLISIILAIGLLAGSTVAMPAAFADDAPEAKEPYTLTVGWSRGADITYMPGESVDNNAWTRSYEEHGIKLEYKLMTVPDQYQQKLALAIASNDLPDVWWSDKKNFYLALDAGVVADITDMYKTELSDLSHKYMDEYDLPFRAATIDGKLMAIPALDEDPTTAAALTFIRHDWLDALGLEVPKTQQELVDTMIAFATKDPDGNGQADTIGFGFKKDLWDVSYDIDGFFNSYHAYPNIWYEDKDGKLVYGTVQSEPMKAALTDLAKLYAAGAIDKEFIVKDADKVGEDVVNERVGVIQGRWWMFGGYPAKAFMADPDKVPDRWWCIDPVSADDQPVLLSSNSSAPDSFMLTNVNSEHPEAVFSLINIWFDNVFSPDLTEEDYKTYTVNEDMQPQSWAYNISLWPYVNPRITNIKGVNDGTIDPATLTGESAVIWKNITAFKEGNYYQTAYDHYWNHSQEDHTSMQIRLRVADRDGTVSDLNYGPSTESMVQYMSTLEQMRDETIVQIITGEKPVDAFDEFVDNWYSLGGQEIVDELNTWYAKVK